VNGPTFAYLLRRAVTLPPHRAAAAAARLAVRHARDLWQRRCDRLRATYSPPLRGAPWCGRVALTAADIPPDLHEPLRLLGDDYLRHRFDLLGSGPIELRYGVACAGFAGCKYPPRPGIVADRAGQWLAAEVNASNCAAAQALWRRIDDPAYRPIDWQLDFRSGYRWHAEAHSTKLPIPIDRGADVKVPWELGRLQHLPRLALCAILGAAGTPGFAEAARYATALRSQLLDFLALNPPRFGVNWMCPMDAAIRVANLLLATDLMVGAGLGPDQDLIEIVLGVARDHARHVADRLEWSRSGRGNHYLADLVGLLWAAAYLPSEPWIDAVFAFAAVELLDEADRQFGDDGGNREGSTNYHRLSAELVLFGIALLAGLSPQDRARLERARPDALRLRPRPRGWSRTGVAGGVAAAGVPALLQKKLYRAGTLIRAATRPDGRVIQIGDTDSGRLFKLTPAGRLERGNGEPRFCEDALDHRATADAIAALFAGGDLTPTPDTALVRALAGGRRFPRPAPGTQATTVDDHGDLDEMVAAIEALPIGSRRRRFVRFAGPVAIDAWRRAAFPFFGLYIFATDRAFVAFRCASEPPADAPLGHAHDDNLGVEYVLDGASRIDPGTLCYTPSRVLRDRYRSAAAHDVVRAHDWDVAPPGAAMFGLDHEAWAECLAWGPAGVAGEIAARRGRLLRALRLTPAGLEIFDGVSPPNRLRPVAPQVSVAEGYGELAPCTSSGLPIAARAAVP
jgi:hypothetical protein